MFFFTYLRRELRMRAGRTVLTVLGLAIGVGLVAAITSVSNGLDAAQQDVLNPLGSIGTDLLVTRPVDLQQAQDQAGGTGAPGDGTGPQPGFGGPGAFGGGEVRALVEENASVVTDLSKLGDPGDHFVHDFFLPATQLTFPAESASQVASLDGVQAVGKGLTLMAVHQEGTVPEIVAEIQTGGETFDVQQQIEPPTEEELAKIRACQQKAQQDGTGGRDSFRQCFPDRFQNFRARFTTPQRTIQQVVNPPQTDITSSTYTIGGVDLTTPDLAIITPAQLTEGSFLSERKQALLAEAYADREGIAVGDTLDLNGKELTVVGLVKPPLSGQQADVYIPLDLLQTLAGREGRVNVLLVRADDAAAVSTVSSEVPNTVEGARVTDAKDLADTVSGSLVDAANLADRLGLVLSIVLLVAAFMIASLLSLSSISKRVRELGTLKAIGWSKRLVVRQVVGESLAQGAIGGVLGIGLGIGAASIIAALSPPLQAQAAGSGGSFFGLGSVGATTAETISLSAPIALGTILLAFGLALLGGLIAGAAGAWRAARLRPSEAMRVVG